MRGGHLRGSLPSDVAVGLRVPSCLMERDTTLRDRVAGRDCAPSFVLSREAEERRPRGC